MRLFTLTTAFLMGISTASIAVAEDFSKEDIQKIIKEYIAKNPEDILDSIEEYGRAQEAAKMIDRQVAIEENMEWLEGNDLLPVAGNPDGDITIVEFFDYNCGYCKKALSDVMTLMGEDKNLKFIFVEMPILGRTSEIAARWAMAAREQNAYLEFHMAAMKNKGPLNEQSLEKIVKKIGLDIDKIKKDASSEKITKIVTDKAEKAASMGITGTPAFIIGGQLYGGYIGIDRMREAVKEAREANKDNQDNQE